MGWWWFFCKKIKVCKQIAFGEQQKKMADSFFTKCFTALQQLWHRFLGEMFSTVVMLESITCFKKCATNNDLHFRVEFTFFFQVQFYFSLELGGKFNYTRFSWSLFSRVMIMFRTSREVFWKRRRVFNQLSSIFLLYYLKIPSSDQFSRCSLF